MRLNLPVTQREYQYPDNETLVSTTDLSSKITYCNPSFINVSGYSVDELIGQPHNLIRHPDMPQEAYRDMWETIQSGHPWSALVKNRRKDGDHYWVVANVTPILEGGKPVGYMSVRTKPTPEQVQSAEVLYARMRQEKENGKQTLSLHRGQLISTGLWGKVQRSINSNHLTLKILLCFAGLEIVRRGLEYLFSSWIIEYGVGAIAAFFLALLLARSVRKPVETALNIANRMAAGDLSQHTQITRRDEFAALFRALNQLNVNLKAVVGDVRKEVHGINDASREIALGNSDLSSRTESQASNLEQTAASMEQLTSTVKQSADTAQQASQFSTQTTEVARKGGEAVAQVVETMEEIRESSKKIADIIQVIDSIAFQTNILALNAAVEAARAGEQGRGFAVVASEVRSLAQRTSTAAREIKELITDSVSKVESGAGHVSKAGTTMHEIQHSVQRVSDLINEISSATGEQYAGINQVNEAVSQLDTMTQQNAALVEQSAAAAESLKMQAEILSQSVRIFRLN